MEVEGRPRVHLHEYKLQEDPHDYGLADDPFTIEAFKQKLKIVIIRNEGDDLEFDMIGVHAAFPNAFRRIMLSEVPSMAIEKVYIYNNTSIIQDEVLAHRLGLIPLRADPRSFKYRENMHEDGGTEDDTLEFELKVKCTRKKETKDSATPDNLYKNHKVYSGQIKWVPKGNQAERFKEGSIGSIHEDILISQMRPGHELDLRLVAIKGVGKDHAKFSPVATAYYRLLPEVRLLRPVHGKQAILLQKCFSPGVIGIDNNDDAYVKDPRYDNCSRNVYRYPELADAVSMTRVRDHFIFNVESVGAMRPDEIFLESIRVLRAKCKKLLEHIEES